MLRSCLKATLLLTLALVPAVPGTAQLPVEDWTVRPDSRAPAGIKDDAILARGDYEVAYSVQTTSYSEILFGTDKIPPTFVLIDWDNVPIGMTVQRHEIEIRGGILSWLGASLRVPLLYTSTEFATEALVGTPTTFGFGDVEIRALYSLHDAWPYRAHLIAGVSLPTGAIDHTGRLPDRPTVEVVLPYSMQPGDGTIAVLPGAVFVAENEAGTVGVRGDARIPLMDNSRDWTRGAQFDANVWMAYRFTDWVSGSVRINYRTMGNVEGLDPDIYPFATPASHPALQGGTRVDLPIGVNFIFPQGPLGGNRISAEFVLPMHQDLDGPQISATYGAAFTWAVMF